MKWKLFTNIWRLPKIIIFTDFEKNELIFKVCAFDIAKIINFKSVKPG